MDLYFSSIFYYVKNTVKIVFFDADRQKRTSDSLSTPQQTCKENNNLFLMPIY